MFIRNRSSSGEIETWTIEFLQNLHLCFRLEMSGTQDNKLLDGISDIVIDERNAREREKYGSILTTAQRSTIEEMKERNKEHDLITTVANQVVRYPLTVFCFGMTVRAFCKGMSGMVTGG